MTFIGRRCDRKLLYRSVRRHFRKHAVPGTDKKFFCVKDANSSQFGSFFAVNNGASVGLWHKYYHRVYMITLEKQWDRHMKARWLLAALSWLVAAPTSARDLVMIAPDIPPHFERDGGGRVGEVIRTALDRCGHRVRFKMVPFGRHWKDYVDDVSLDGLATAEADQSFPGFSTKPFIHLQDGATVLERSDLKSIASPEQLSGRRVVAFPAADKILGIESVVPRFKTFDMREGRFDQLRPLFAGRADAVLADGLITARYISLLRERAAQGQEPDIDPSVAVVFRRIFASGPQRLYFRDRALADDFDRCAGELKAEGLLQSISKRVVDRYRSILGDQYPID